MLDKKLVALMVIAASANMIFSGSSIGANLQIKQEGYLYRMPLTQNIYTETFVITSESAPKIIGEGTRDFAPLSPSSAAVFTHPIVAHFNINSSEILPDQAHKIHSELRGLKVLKTTNLVVTGFTCSKGTDQLNWKLSSERAIAVAGLLQNEGFTVARIEGKGESNLVSKKYYPLNRRVEITQLKK